MRNPLREYKERTGKTIHELAKMTNMSDTNVVNILSRDQEAMGTLKQSTHVTIKKKLGIDLDPKVELIIK